MLNIEVGSISSFLLYITCPPNDVQVILDETRSYSQITQRERLDKFIIQALKSKLNKDACTSSENHSIYNDTMVGSKIRTAKNTGSRLVYSKQISTSKKISKNQEPLFDDDDSSPSSPFSSAFMEDLIIDWKKSSTEPIPPNDKTKYIAGSIQHHGSIKENKVSEPSEKIEFPDFDNGMQWTRTRIKALESQIRTLANVNESSMNVGINITKDMLSTAKFIAQLDCKFIIVNMKGIICAIDQHAADERIGLERLEKALLDKISTANNNSDEKVILNLSKKEHISSDDLIKYVPIQKSKVIHLSVSQLQTIRNHKQTLNDWKFNLILSKGSLEVTLIGVPGIGDRVASSNDFIQFLQAIERRSTDVSLVKPAFVKRALASYACRYAIMFGDSLSDRQCINMISELSKCDMSFMCAHGRPSVVPLVDLSMIEANNVVTNKSIFEKKRNDQFDNREVPLRFQKHNTWKFYNRT